MNSRLFSFYSQQTKYMSKMTRYIHEKHKSRHRKQVAFLLNVSRFVFFADVVNRVRNGESIPFRPALPDTTDLGKTTLELIQKCWSETPDERHNFQHIRNILNKMTGGE